MTLKFYATINSSTTKTTDIAMRSSSADRDLRQRNLPQEASLKCTAM